FLTYFIYYRALCSFPTRRSSDLLSFAMKRFFRIYPLLFVSLILFILFFDIEGHSLPASFVPLHADYEAKGPTYGYHLHSPVWTRSEEHTSELQSRFDLVCRLLHE